MDEKKVNWLLAIVRRLRAAWKRRREPPTVVDTGVYRFSYRGKLKLPEKNDPYIGNVDVGKAVLPLFLLLALGLPAAPAQAGEPAARTSDVKTHCCDCGPGCRCTGGCNCWDTRARGRLVLPTALLPWRAQIEFELRNYRRDPPAPIIVQPAPPVTDPAVLDTLRRIEAQQGQIIAILQAQRFNPLPGPLTVPAPAAPAQPIIIYSPPGSRQDLPITGVPYQALPIGGAPLQTFPIPGSPLHILPIPGAPHLIVPPGPGQPLQVLPLGPPTTPVAPLPVVPVPVPVLPVPAAPTPAAPLPAVPAAPLQPLPLTSPPRGAGVLEGRTPPPEGYQTYTRSPAVRAIWKPSPQR